MDSSTIMVLYKWEHGGRGVGEEWEKHMAWSLLPTSLIKTSAILIQSGVYGKRHPAFNLRFFELHVIHIRYRRLIMFLWS